MSDEGYSLSGLYRELDELRKDFIAFSQSYDILRKRILESTEAQPARTPELHTWSGTRAVCGSLEMSIHAIERTILGYEELIQKVLSGEVKNADPPKPSLTLVKETDTP